MSSRPLRFHPFVVLLLSLAGALLYALWITWRFSGGDLSGQYLYVVPIVVPFVAFVLDRIEQFPETTIVGVIMDALVVGTAMMRVIVNVPYVSGHVLFLIYAVLRPGSLVTRITAGLVMLEVIYLKFFVWHDLITPLTGSALAMIAALIARRYGNRRTTEQRPGKRLQTS